EPADERTFAAVDARLEARVIPDGDEARLNRADRATRELPDENVAVVDVHSHHRAGGAHDALGNKVLHRPDDLLEAGTHEEMREIHDRRAVSLERRHLNH